MPTGGVARLGSKLRFNGEKSRGGTGRPTGQRNRERGLDSAGAVQAMISGMNVREKVALSVLRFFFVVVVLGLAAFFAVQLANLGEQPGKPPRSPWLPWIVFGVMLSVAMSVLASDMLLPRKRIETISAVYFGLIVGLVLSYAVSLALTPYFEDQSLIRKQVQTALAVLFCYICISLLLQTQDDFRFLIPYVEFSKEVKGLVPYLLDTSVVIDGRIVDLVSTNVFDNSLVMPRFILEELHKIADSGDRLRRARGRRGLDVLNALQKKERIDFQILDRETVEMKDQSVDIKLVLLAKELNGKIITGDYNLNKIAQLHGVAVINLNEIANALKPVFLPGERFDVQLVKPGENPDQGVGYLDDGTMVVVEGGRSYLGRRVELVVTSVLQTSAGRMIFGRYEKTIDGTPKTSAKTPTAGATKAAAPKTAATKTTAPKKTSK